MFDEQEHLLRSPILIKLLRHYGSSGIEDRERWQDRLMSLEGASRRDLVRLHGELIAYGWLEQSTGMTLELRPESAPSCYRITREGLRIFKSLPQE